MKASQMIQSLQRYIKKYGDLPVFTNENEYEQYAGEAEAEEVKYADEIDDRAIDKKNYLPNRFYIKT